MQITLMCFITLYTDVHKNIMFSNGEIIKAWRSYFEITILVSY